MNMIVAVDDQWGIGKDGKLLAHIPEDLKYFKNKTYNKVVVMGRKTLESLPGEKPLSDRLNIVLSKDTEWGREGCVIVNNLEELFDTLEKYEDNEIFVIGGAQIYEELIGYCDTIYVTKIFGNYNADTFFPRLDGNKDFQIVECSELQIHNETPFYFAKYMRNM